MLGLAKNWGSKLLNAPFYITNQVTLTTTARTKKTLLCLSAFSLIMIAKCEMKKNEILALIALKKERLQMPVYELKGEELYDFPWNKDNLDEWLYRPIKVFGRQIPRQQCKANKYRGGIHGFHLIMPVVTDEPEDRDLDKRKGILVNRGWMHNLFRNENMVFEPQDNEYPQTFIGYLSDGEDHKKFFLQEANIITEQKLDLNNFYLPELARATGWLNKDKVKLAVLEQCD